MTECPNIYIGLTHSSLRNGKVTLCQMQLFCVCMGLLHLYHVITGCKVPSDLVILLDSSTSVAESNFRLMIRFLSAIVQDANIDTGHVRVSLVTFSEDAQVKFLLKDYTQKETLLDALTRVPYIYGGTNTAQGLQLLRTTVFSKVNGDRKDVANVALLMTDGIGSHWIKGGQGDMVYREARRLRNQGVRLVTLGIGKYKGKVKELKKLASQPYKQFVISISDFKQLDSIRKRVQHALCEGKNFMFDVTSVLLFCDILCTSDALLKCNTCLFLKKNEN